MRWKTGRRSTKVYIDLTFYDELKNRFHAPGDFAQAYVIAHEVGHHVQNLLGISSQVSRAQRAVGESEANALSVQLELQADCLAGVWAHHAERARDLLEQGDVEEGLNAAAQIGNALANARLLATNRDNANGGSDSGSTPAEDSPVDSSPGGG